MFQESDYYDRLHMDSVRTYEHFSRHKYYDMWKIALRIIGKNKIRSIVDIGCGTGQFGDMATHFGFNYVGVDISAWAVELCARKGLNVYRADVCNSGWSKEIDVFGCVSFETLEHLKDDIKVITNMPKKTLFIFSVPTFMEKSHVRCFKKEKEILKRYSSHINIREIHKFKKRFMVEALT